MSGRLSMTATHCIGKYPSHLEAFCCIRNPMMHHDVETGSHLTRTVHLLRDRHSGLMVELVKGPFLAEDGIHPELVRLFHMQNSLLLPK